VATKAKRVIHSLFTVNSQRVQSNQIAVREPNGSDWYALLDFGTSIVLLTADDFLKVRSAILNYPIPKE